MLIQTVNTCALLNWNGKLFSLQYIQCTLFHKHPPPLQLPQLRRLNWKLSNFFSLEKGPYSSFVRK